MLRKYTEYFSGNTVRIEFEFKDFNEVYVDPAIKNIKIYDLRRNIIAEQSLDDSNKIETGKYFYDYQSDTSFEGTLFYEVYAEIDGNPSVSRDGMTFVFIK